ncbi:MAG: hypothetical protein ACFFA6_04215 [Promethearchaeota archaeon]
MNSCELLEPIEYYFKKKLCLIGNLELYKNEFQKKISSNCLPLENKENIGVNISKIEYIYQKNKRHQKFEFLLWNIDCRQQRSFLRTIFYNGAEAMIVFISDTKIEQIYHYLYEIRIRMPTITIIFCIILENFSKEEILEVQLENEDLKSFMKNNNIQINEISEPSVILDQVCSISLSKIKNKEIENCYITDFIPLQSLITHSSVKDNCNDYYEPQPADLKIKKRINTEILLSFLSKIGINIKNESQNWVRIKNENFGTFSIYLKNGNVYYFPIICEKCKDKKCLTYKKAPFFICIEAESGSQGWSNIKGFNRNELLIISKIIALKEGDESNLPKSVIKQIKKINNCLKFK